MTLIQENVYLLEEEEYLEHCNVYLFVGKSKCLLVDLGIGLLDLDKIKEISQNKEIIPILTHFHFDHFGGHKKLNKILANKKNLLDTALKYFDKKDLKIDKDLDFDLELQNFIQIEEKSTIDIGNFIFEVIFTPGHDATSLSLFEKEKKILISGDLLYDGELITDLEDSNLDHYIKSLEQVKLLKPKIILGGHNKPVEKNIKHFIEGKIKDLEHQQLPL